MKVNRSLLISDIPDVFKPRYVLYSLLVSGNPDGEQNVSILKIKAYVL